VAYWAHPPEDFEPYDVFAPAEVGAVGRPAPTAVETYEGLTPRSVTGSALVYLDFGDDPSPEVMPAFDGGALSGGADGQPVTASDFIGKEGVDGRFTAQGLEALNETEFDEVALVHAPHPGADSDAIDQAIVSHCESNRFRFALLDCNPGTTPITSLNPRTRVDTKFAAFYCPWLTVADPLSGARTTVPPGGYVAGIYVRTDSERGVHTAPANEVVRGALALEIPIRDSEQEILNPRGVNTIREFTGRGIRVWGARTLSSDPEWKYVNVRRLFIYLERSIAQGLQWAVFEPNGETLWARVTDTVRLFLRTTWRSGALQGLTEDEAFFVKCDRTTMTQNDLDNGQLICLIGVATIKPAEFVIFRIGVRTAQSAT
jgi:phage tail sheath protein FI